MRLKGTSTTAVHGIFLHGTSLCHAGTSIFRGALALLVLLCLVPHCAAADDAAPADAFGALLDEGQLVFTRPPGFVDLPPGRNPILDYEHALREAQPR